MPVWVAAMLWWGSNVGWLTLNGLIRPLWYDPGCIGCGRLLVRQPMLVYSNRSHWALYPLSPMARVEMPFMVDGDVSALQATIGVPANG